jgi:hypothetical protein
MASLSFQGYLVTPYTELEKICFVTLASFHLKQGLENQQIKNND